jgi:uncharacterized repeat protein (TIGR03803 family)
VTLEDGEFYCGTAFQLSPPTSKGGAWTETRLHSFSDSNGDGAYPLGNLILDKGGDLYGVTEQGGASGQNGTAYRLTPPKTKGGVWSEELLDSFKGGSDGKYPFAGLVFDSGGNLYGITGSGVPALGVALTVAEPCSGSSGRWQKVIGLKPCFTVS